MNGVDSQTSNHIEVLVLGAGPVGLAAALALRAHGRQVAILEGEPEDRQRPGSRAIFIHRATLKNLEQISPGLGKVIASHGLVWPTKRTFWRGREVFVRNYPTPDPNGLPPFSSLPQVQIERFLMAACEKAGIEIFWNFRVKEVETSDTGVIVKSENGQFWAASYAVGADGSRSTTRKALGISMEGSRSNNSYIVVDVIEDEKNPLPLERIFHYEHPAVGGRNVLLVPFVGGWRVDLQCKEKDNPEEFSGIEGVRKWLPKVLPSKYAERISWVSTYQFLQLLAKEFTDRHKRILLAGEAAHLFAPFGARGMNSGVADAVEAANSINSALKASDSEEAYQAVEKYAASRKAAAVYNRAAAGQALAHIHAQGLVNKSKRIIAGLAAPYITRAGEWLDEGPYGPKSGPPGQTSGKY